MGKRKISNGTAILMIAFAIFFDLLNIVVDLMTLGVGSFIVDFFTGLFFAFWFSMHHISLASSRNVGRTLIAALMSALPVTDFVFPWVWQVGYTAFTERYPVEQSLEQEQPRQRSSFRL